ncbi:MAG: cation-translocating P-type ATPase C-terminal domain-containing protein [Chloroflexi bacterium]|nr:cation-translocating P-type ATPase C-terminal domain-containing protein [Chloroflexota bacterium]
MLLPMHVVFLELIIDPACSIAFEAEREESNVMRRPPRDQQEPLFSRRTIALSLLQGFAVLFVTLAIYGISQHQGRGETEARTLTFVTLVLANLGLILSNRSWSTGVLANLRSRNRAFLFIVVFAFVFLGLVVHVPALQRLLQLHALSVSEWMVCLGAGVACILWFELVKCLGRTAPKKAGHATGV